MLQLAMRVHAVVIALKSPRDGPIANRSYRDCQPIGQGLARDVTP
jgi:hypothetical protein